MPHSTSRQVMQRSLSIVIFAIWTSRHPHAGRSSAGVGHDAAQGIVSHMMQAADATSITGVPAARPCDDGSIEIT